MYLRLDSNVALMPCRTQFTSLIKILKNFCFEMRLDGKIQYYKRIFEQLPFMHRVHRKRHCGGTGNPLHWWVKLLFQTESKSLPVFWQQSFSGTHGTSLFSKYFSKTSLRLRKVNKVKWILRVYRKWLHMMEIDRIDHPKVWWSITLPKVLLAQVYLS